MSHGERATGPVPGWGLGDAVGGLLVANVVAAIIGSAILAAAGAETTDDVSLGLVVALQTPLWVGLLAAVVYAGRKGAGIVEDFGARSKPSDIVSGGLAGGVTQIIVVPLLYLPIFWIIGDRDVSAAARELTDKAVDPLGVALLILVVAIAAPVVEELFYRGLLLRALERRIGGPGALVVSSAVFGLVHLQLLQLPALIVAGLVFGVLVQRTGRLGPAVFAHMAFNGLAVAALLASA
ncbi:hypothetical protein BH20ACT2_BH20ACT2_17750 [soil metagenome]